MAILRAVAVSDLAKSDASRGPARSTSPYYDLNDSVEVARVIHREGGGSCTREQLAAWLKYKGTNNGAFVNRVIAAKSFGVITQVGDKLIVTDLGRAIIAPETPATELSARVAAFLGVALFKQLFDRYKSTELPKDVGMKNLLTTTFGMVPDRAGPAITVFLNSAEQAGFFKATGDRSRLVLPAMPSAPGGPTPPVLDKLDTYDDRAGGGGSGGGGSGATGSGTQDVAGIPEEFIGLLRGFPASGTVLTAKKRAALVKALTATAEWIYPDADDEGS
jgi:hypothetical protein